MTRSRAARIAVLCALFAPAGGSGAASAHPVTCTVSGSIVTMDPIVYPPPLGYYVSDVSFTAALAGTCAGAGSFGLDGMLETAACYSSKGAGTIDDGAAQHAVDVEWVASVWVVTGSANRLPEGVLVVTPIDSCMPPGPGSDRFTAVGVLSLH